MLPTPLVLGFWTQRLSELGAVGASVAATHCRSTFLAAPRFYSRCSMKLESVEVPYPSGRFDQPGNKSPPGFQVCGEFWTRWRLLQGKGVVHDAGLGCTAHASWTGTKLLEVETSQKSLSLVGSSSEVGSPGWRKQEPSSV